MIDSNDIGLGAYFHQNKPAGYTQNLTNRAINALRRAGISTMSELSAISDEDLGKLRLLGEKSRKLVLLMREKYMP